MANSTLAGIVRGNDGNRLEDATVELDGVSTLTDQLGVYSLTVTASNYTLTVTKTGYVEHSEEIDLTTPDYYNKDITLVSCDLYNLFTRYSPPMTDDMITEFVNFLSEIITDGNGNFKGTPFPFV